VQLALIGAGRMGRMHLQAVSDSETVRVGSIVDPSAQARSAAVAVDARAGCHASIDEALEGGRIEGVLIAAPTPLHRSLVTACAGRGLPILCEKPCGFSVDEIDAAAAAAREAGVLLQIGYWRRYVPELVALRHELREGRFGDLLQICCSQWDEEPPATTFRQSSGGIAIDMGVHELDQIRWLTGRELEPAADVSTAGPVAGDVDCATITFAVAGGGVAIVSLGRYFPHGDCVWVEVMGTRDYRRIDVLWGDRGKTWHSALRAQAEDFARCVRKDTAPAGASAQDARRTLELAALAQDRIQAAAG
jgi:myo-inositol 2-dehydrogenase / D-chiro-inositol 1-dehydrogenase